MRPADRSPRAIASAAVSIVLAASGILFWPPQRVPATGQVVAAYAFSEGSGVLAADFSGHGNTGTLTDGPAWITAGRYGNALSFDGVDDHLVVADSSSLDLTTAFTLAAWVHPTAAVPAGGVLRKAGASTDVYAIGLTADSLPYVVITTSAGSATFVGDEPVFANRWTHIAAAYSGSSVRLFINGIKEWSWPLSGAVSSSSGSLTMGGSAAAGFFEGRIDEVRVDAFALDVGDVRDDMNTPVDPSTPLTVGTLTPASGARGVLVTPITARFTRSLDPATVTTSTFQLRSGASVVSATLSYDTATRTVTLTPTSPLGSLTDYSVTVLGGPSGVKDSGGDELAATVVWSFQTGSAPETVRLSYGFGEGAGTSVDDASGNGNTGSLLNGPVWTTEGKYGRALAFGGVDDTIRVSDADTQDVTTAMTLEAWVYPTAAPSIAKIVHKQHYAPDHSYWIGLAAGAPYARIRTTAGTYSLVAPSEVPLDEWTHLAATYDGAVLRVFVNGLETASQAAAGDVLVSHKPLWVGSAFNAEWFQGRIDDVRLYARALTPAEIVDDMHTSVEDIAGPTVTATNPLADAVDIPAGTHVTATFSEPLAASSVSASTFELRDALGALVPATVTYDAPSRTAVLDPASDLDAGSVYTATLKGGTAGPRITDVAGNPMATGHSWSFTTGTAPGAPVLVGVSVFPRAMSLSVGASHQFAATAHFSDGTTTDVSSTATWHSTATGVLSVNASGRATAEGPGDSVLAATYQGQTGEAPVTVYEGEAIPPDPRDVAPPLDRTTTTPLFTASAFLYTGENPIQRGVAAGTMEARRVSVIRGTVIDRDAQPLTGVRVSIAGHPELGHTLTRLDGGYEMAVNGGGVLTVEYTRPGLLPARRPAQTAWQDYAHVPDVVMIALDPSVTPIDLASATSIQAAQGSVVTDADGARQATLLVAPGTTATLVMPDGIEQSAPALSVRATEYSVGPNGERAMPAPLPPTSGYTYAVEYSADEALAAGAREVRFNQPVITYTTNFVGFPAGEVVPSGYFDRALNAWVASDNGRVMQVVGETGGRSDLDVDGSGAPSTQAALDELGITDAERESLASLYEPGDSLWRVPVTHFSAYDYNWPIHPDDGAGPPNLRGGRSRNEAEPDCEAGSIIDCQNQTLGEEIPVAGAPFVLHYRSSRAPGRRSAFTLEGPLTNATIPPPLKRVELEISVAGRRFNETYPAQANQSYTFTWDGRDGYDRRVQGSVKATVVVYYVYDGTYSRPRSERRSFALTGTQGIVVNEARSEISMSQTFQTYLGLWDMVAGPAGGWSVGVQHFYDGIEEVLYLGNGQRRSVDAEIRSIGVTTAAGSNEVTIGAPTEGVPATSVFLNVGEEVAAAPDGSLYFSELVFPETRLRRVRADGILETVGQVAGQVGAIGPDGSLYLYDETGQVVRRRAPDGTVSIVAGTLNQSGYTGDGGPATEARLNGPCGLAASADGALYIAEHTNDVIRRVDSAGTITTIAGTGQEGVGPYGGAATDARFTQACGLAAGPDGSLYVADIDAVRVLRITPDGIIREFAGNGSFGTTGDGGLATTASIDGPWKVSVSPSGTVYIAVFAGGIRRVDTQGIITTLAGADGPAVPGDTGPAAATPLRTFSVATAPDGAVYTTTRTPSIAFGTVGQLRRIGPILPGLTGQPMAVASEDGAEVYVFDETGRHLRTVNALTGAISLAFEYDGLGRLSAIVDGDGNVTTFERASGVLSRIVAPGDVATSVGVNPLGLLSHVTDPAGNRWDMAYAADGLLLTFQDPNRGTSTFTYAADGRLMSESNAAGGGVTLDVDEQADATVTTLTTALSRQTRYQVDQVVEGQRRRNTSWAGLVDETIRGWGFIDTHTAPDGTVVEITRDADPRWQMDVPLTSMQLTTPGGLVSTMSTAREVQLSNPADPLSLTFQRELVTVNGRTHEREYEAATRTFFSRTPEGRTATTAVDAQGRVVEWAPASLTPVQFTYDTTGLLTAIAQGTRQSTIAYDAERRPATLTDAVGRQVSFTYDAAGRVLTQTLPDARAIEFAYDANGNVTTLVPPGRPAHTFTYTPVDLAAT